MLRYLYHIILLTFALFLFPACSQDGPAEMEEDTGLEFRMLLRVPTSVAEDPETRAADLSYDGDGENEGLDYLMTRNDIRILFFQENKFKEEAHVTSFSRVGGSTTFHEYMLTGRLQNLKKPGDGNYGVVVLANMDGQIDVNTSALPALVPENDGSYTPQIPLDTPEQTLYDGLTFDYAPSQVFKFAKDNWEQAEVGATENDARIPMWGKVTKALTTGEILEIDMMRAMAKVRVELHPSLTANYKISGITLHGYSDKGMMVPDNASAQTETTNYSPSLPSPASTLNIPAAAQHATTLGYFYETQSGSSPTGKWYAYLPETKNTGADAGKCYMDVTIRHSQDGLLTGEYKYRLEFGDYSPLNEGGTDYQGTLFDVKRNHYYQYVIVGVDDHNAHLKYQVCDWSKYSTEIIFN